LGEPRPKWIRHQVFLNDEITKEEAEANALQQYFRDGILVGSGEQHGQRGKSLCIAERALSYSSIKLLFLFLSRFRLSFNILTTDRL